MPMKKRSLGKAALLGFVLGPVILVLKPYVLGGHLPRDPAELTGYLIGGALFGAIVFPIVAVIRNRNAG